MKSTLSLYQRGDTWTYHLAWYEGGKGGKRRQVKRGGFPSKREARRAAEAHEKTLTELGWRAETDDTLDAWLDTWLDSLVVVGRARSTVASYRRKLAYVRPELGARRLADIDTTAIDRLYAKLLARGGRLGKPLSARTVRFTHAVLRKAFEDAHRKGLIATNPAAEASAPSSRAAKAPEAKTWTPGELAQYLELTRDDYYAPVWRTIAFSGVRRAEACGLRWNDVDFASGTLAVVVTLNQVKDEVYEGTTKTEGSERVIDLDDDTLAVLRAWRRRQTEMRLLVGAGWHDSGRVFTNPNGEAIRPDTLTQAWTRSVARSGLPRIRLHDLRHTHATLLLTAGRSHREIADRLGHEDAGFTLRTYTHTQPGAQREGAQAVATLVRNSVTNSATKRSAEHARDVS
jgi:integrase